MQDNTDSLNSHQVLSERPGSYLSVKKVSSVAFNNLAIKSDVAKKPSSIITIVINFVTGFNPEVERVRTLVRLLRKDHMGQERELDCEMLETAIRTELPHIKNFENLLKNQLNIIAKYLASSIANELKRSAVLGNLTKDQVWNLDSKKYAQIVMQSIREATRIINDKGMDHLIRLAKNK